MTKWMKAWAGQHAIMLWSARTALALAGAFTAGCGMQVAPHEVELPSDCAQATLGGVPLGCFSSCPDGVTCAYVYEGTWPDPGSSCSMYECASKPARVEGCTWEQWSDVGASPSSTQGFVCGDGPKPRDAS